MSAKIIHAATRLAAKAAMAALCVSTLSFAAQAQDAKAPEGPIEITVGCGAGCTPDILMRRAAKIWNDTGIITNPIVIVNRPGGGMTTAMNYVLAREGSPNDLMALAEPVFSSPVVQGIPSTYNQFTPLGVFVQTQLVMLTTPDHEANNLTELVAIAKAKPGQIRMAGSSAGGTDDQILGLLENATGSDMTFIPHSGGGAAQATFLGGNVDLITLTIDEALPLIQSGRAKPLAIFNAERRSEEALAGIPTATEQGVEVVWGQVFGLLGAPKLDPALVAWWTTKIEALAATKEWQASISENFLSGDVIVGPQLPGRMDEYANARVEVLHAIGAAKQ